MTNKEYAERTKQASPNSKTGRDVCNAFWVGGLICAAGQGLVDLYARAGLDEKKAGMATSVTLIALAIVLTGFGLYQKAAKFAGAGTLVPITGFANAMSAPAIEFKPEGHVMGIGAKMFSIAGPVVIYGLLASFVYGLVLMLFKLF